MIIIMPISSQLLFMSQSRAKVQNKEGELLMNRRYHTILVQSMDNDRLIPISVLIFQVAIAITLSWMFFGPINRTVVLVRRAQSFSNLKII